MNEIKIVTHNGRFHADDVFGVATLFLFLQTTNNPELKERAIKVIRTREEALFKEADFILDVGGEYDEEQNKFDHHQSGGAGVRANGIPYASFGLIWKKFGALLCGSPEVAHKIEKKLVMPVDAYDNGFSFNTSSIEDVEPYLFDDFIYSFYPTWKEPADTFDATFLELVNIAQELLEREIKNAQAKEEAKSLVLQTYNAAPDKRVIVLDSYLPWRDVLISQTEPLFVVYQVPEDNKWHVTAVPAEKGHVFKNRKDLPQEWAGLRNQELAEKTGVSDAVFCHNKLFLAVALSKEGALELAKKALHD